MYQQSRQPGQIGGSPYSNVSTQTLLGQVLGITGIGFVITAIAAYLTASLNLPSVASIVAMVIGFGFLFGISFARNKPGLSLIMFCAFTACEGVGLGPVIASYTRLDGPGVVINAAATTAMGMIVLAGIAFISSYDFRKLSGIAFGLLIGLVIVSLIGAFTHFFSPTIISWATLAVFAVLTLVDFARIKNSSSASGAGPVQLAVSIYLDALNIFLALLQIFGNRSRDD